MYWGNCSNTALLRCWWRHVVRSNITTIFLRSFKTRSFTSNCGEFARTKIFKTSKRATRTISKLKSRQLCRPTLKNLKLLTVFCLYVQVLKNLFFYKYKCELIKGCDIHANYRTEWHETVVFEIFTFSGWTLIRKIIFNFNKNAPMPTAFKSFWKKRWSQVMPFIA